MTRVMGIVNVTPDSFSDGGLHASPQAAIEHGLTLLAGGADILDIGGESTRPGARPIEPEEEIARVMPVLSGLLRPAREAGAILSIDTRNADTMKAALFAGADIVNDVSALTHDERSLRTVAASGARIVLMHMQGTPETMQASPTYVDVVAEVRDWLQHRIDACEAAGIARGRLIVDPGIGFGKSLEHNLALLHGLPAFKALGTGLLVGVSRKQFVARLSGGEPPTRRLGGSLAAALFAAERGADIVRVHDVAETVQALKVGQALHAPAEAGPIPP